MAAFPIYFALAGLVIQGIRAEAAILTIKIRERRGRRRGDGPPPEPWKSLLRPTDDDLLAQLAAAVVIVVVQLAGVG